MKEEVEEVSNALKLLKDANDKSVVWGLLQVLNRADLMHETKGKESREKLRSFYQSRIKATPGAVSKFLSEVVRPATKFLHISFGGSRFIVYWSERGALLSRNRRRTLSCPKMSRSGHWRLSIMKRRMMRKWSGLGSL